MAAEQRKLLEQLMGAESNRNEIRNEESYAYKGNNWDDTSINNNKIINNNNNNSKLNVLDSNVCKAYLVGYCPHDLFTNTKQDLGVCPKIHSEVLKEEVENMKNNSNNNINDNEILETLEIDYLNILEKYIIDCNRRIESLERRLNKTPEEEEVNLKISKELSSLDYDEEELLYEARLFGLCGHIDQGLNNIYIIQTHKLQRLIKENELNKLKDNFGSSGHQKLIVCEICSAYLSKLDNDRRLADHFTGKMHIGYVKMRKDYNALDKKYSYRLKYEHRFRRDRRRKVWRR